MNRNKNFLEILEQNVQGKTLYYLKFNTCTFFYITRICHWWCILTQSCFRRPFDKLLNIKYIKRALSPHLLHLLSCMMIGLHSSCITAIWWTVYSGIERGWRFLEEEEWCVKEALLLNSGSFMKVVCHIKLKKYIVFFFTLQLTRKALL